MYGNVVFYLTQRRVNKTIRATIMKLSAHVCSWSWVYLLVSWAICSGGPSAPNAIAADMNWSGRYRFETLQITNPDAQNVKTQKAYSLHHLSLQPKIVATDSVNILGKFELLNNTAFPNSQLGQYMGHGPGPTSGS